MFDPANCSWEKFCEYINGENMKEEAQEEFDKYIIMAYKAKEEAEKKCRKKKKEH